MVIESIINPTNAEKHPWELLFIGFLYASISVIFSLWIFKDQASLIMVFLTSLVAVPLVYATFKLEEKKDTIYKGERSLLKQHSRAIEFLLFLFIGFILAFTLFYLLLPSDLSKALFSVQTSTIDSINSRVSGNSVFGAFTLNRDFTSDTLKTDLTSAILNSSFFMSIFSNNIKVLLFSFFFSFFYGMGAIFILTWNATVISAAIGNYFRNAIANYAGIFGFSSIFSYFHVFSLSIMRYMTHGIFEIAAYFIAGLAGGIISFGIINHDFKSESFKNVLFDSLSLMMMALVIIFVAALVEVYITPAIF